MKITLAIKNYELKLLLGAKSTMNTLKVFTKSNTHKITHLFIRFQESDNDKKRPVKQLHEITTTKLRYVRLFLGENQRTKILDFLRHEKNRHFTFTFDEENFTAFGFTDLDDDGLFKDIKSFKVGSFFLHSKGTSQKNNTSTPVLNPDPIFGA